MEVKNPYFADGKDFNSRTSRQKPPKSARLATKMLPKRVLPICYQTDSGQGADRGGSALYILLVGDYDSKTKPSLPVDRKQNVFKVRAYPIRDLHSFRSQCAVRREWRKRAIDQG